jgi:hypothetical protein
VELFAIGPSLFNKPGAIVGVFLKPFDQAQSARICDFGQVEERTLNA